MVERVAQKLIRDLLARSSPATHARMRALRRDLWFLRALRFLPWRVAVFQWRAWRLAGRLGDEFGRVSSTRPWKLATLLKLAADAQFVVELGTAHAWTTISLALTHPDRDVVSYDPDERRERARYLQLVPEQVRRRVTFVCQRGDSGPTTDRPVDLLYIDTLHQRADTIQELDAWRPVLREGAWIVIDDYDHPDYPGVREAVSELGLAGDVRDNLFIHRVADATV